MNNTESKPLVYMLEHDADDRELTEVISRETGHEVNFRFFGDASLFFKALSSTEQQPSVILISYNIRGRAATDVIHHLKSAEKYKRIPVVVLGESASPVIIDEVYACGAASYITKPFTNIDTVEKISGFLNYWFHIVELPSAVMSDQQ